MNGLYAIIDAETLLRAELDVVRFAEAVLSASPAALQLRDKRRDSCDHLRLLRELAPLCANAAVPLFANDRIDLALIAGCSGVHVGQQDMPPRAARELALSAGRDDFLVGMSVHNQQELAVAVQEEPDYIALGPVFPTQSKKNPDPTLGRDGLISLARAVAEAGDWPRVAIGGIDSQRVSTISDDCEMVAVIGALVDVTAPDPYAVAAARAQDLVDTMRSGGAT
jgi:thiamine-phosphate pyrophosphorylase